MDYLSGQGGREMESLDDHLARRSVVMAPVVLAELLSDPALPPLAETYLLSIPRLEITSGFWQRAGKLRADLFRRKCAPKLADTLIAQNCVDHDVPLLSLDRDFTVFAQHSGLKLL